MAGDGRDQIKVLVFMARPEAYAPPPATVERIETHASVVFLAGDFAYKVKRAVKYPFLDFSTLEKRRAACLNELRVNRRTAPQLYLEVVPITSGADGSFCLGREEGPVLEWALRMRRFDQDMLYDRMAGQGRLGLGAMPSLARAIAAFHASADRMLTPDQNVVPLEAVLADNESALAANHDLFSPEAARAFAERSREALATVSSDLRARARSGYVRHCHGDLHLRNIVEIEGEPVLFDALEFDDRLATTDVLYDLAFLLMDLGKRGLHAHANAVLNAYLDEDGSTGNLMGLANLPIFLSMRAMIRAKVENLRAEKAKAGAAAARDEARIYFELAREFLRPSQTHLVAVGGFSGSGKSAVARAIAASIGRFPGSVHVRSDVERKRLFGVAQEQALPAAAYRPAVSGVVYAMCRKRAELALEAGHSVVVDAVHAKPQERDALAALAASAGVPFTGLWLTAPAEVLRARVERRTGDVSDATPRVVDTQLDYDVGSLDFAVIDASLPLDAVAGAALDRIRAKS